MYYILSIFEALTISIFLYSFRKTNNNWIILLTSLLTIILSISIALLLNSDYSLDLILLLSIFSYLYLYLSSNYSISLKIFIISIILSSHAIIYQSIFFVTNSLFYSSLSISFYETTAFTIVRIIIDIIYIFILLMIKNYIMTIKERKDNAFYLLFSILLIFLVFVIDCFELSLYTDEMAKSYTIIILYVFLVFTGVLLYWSIAFAKSISKIQEQDQIIAILRHQQESSEKILNTQKELYQLRHDIKHYINALKYSSEENKEQLSTQLNALTKTNNIIETGYPVINLILSQAKEKTHKEGYDLQCSFNLKKEIDINDSDLYLLLSNSIDNAFIHCGENKILQISIQEIKNYCKITIINSIDYPVLNSNNHFIHKSFGEHGYGFKTIQDILVENNGTLSLNQQNNQFILSMLLPLKTQ